MRRVVVTGMGGVTSLGQNWETVKAGLLAHRNAVRRMHEWDDIEGLRLRLNKTLTGSISFAWTK